MDTHPLKIERKLRGWSQSKLAEALGITTRTVSRWEQGLSVPYPYYREQLCALFGKNARELGMLSEDEENDIEDMQGRQWAYRDASGPPQTVYRDDIQGQEWASSPAAKPVG